MRLGFREVSNLKYEISVSSLKVIHSKTILKDLPIYLYATILIISLKSLIFFRRKSLLGLRCKQE